MRRRAFIVLVAALSGVAAASFAENWAPAIGQGEILRGEFTQERFLTGFEAPLRSEGAFVMAPERGLIWRVHAPFPTVTVITAAGLVQKNDRAELIRLSTSRSPLLYRIYGVLEKTLRGDWQALRALYEVTVDGTADNWAVRLSPRDAAGPSTPFEFADITGGRFAEKVTLRKAGGDVDKLRFSGQVLSSAPLSAEEAALFASAPE